VKDPRFFNEAKKAKAAAAARANELAQQAPGKADELKARATDVKDQIAGQAAEMSEMGFTKLQETLADFDAALPVLREAGYTLESVSIELGIPPKIVAGFSVAAGVPEEKVEAILAENAERKLTILLVKSIYQATKLQSKLNIKGLRPSGVSVELGLIPQIGVKFKPSRTASVEEDD
jgi:ABC-type Zn uptake system ZnuABC Zn-binding protein ZnuA